MINKVCLSLTLILMLTVVNVQANQSQTKTPVYQDVKISPDGKHIAIAMDVEDKRTLAFFELKNMSYVGGAKLPRLSEVGDFFWANNERLVMKVLKKEAWREESLYYGELFAVNVNGTQGEMIYGYRALHDRKARGAGSRFKRKKRLNGSAEIIDLLPNDERNILISSSLWPSKSKPWDRFWQDHGPRHASVYKLDIYNGQFNDKRIAGAPISYATFLANKEGELKAVYGRDKNNHTQLFIMDNEEWQQIPSANFSQEIKPIAINEQGTLLLALDTFKQDRTGLFQLNLANGKYENIFTDKKNNISTVEINKNSKEVYALRFDDEASTYLTVGKSSVESRVHKSLLNIFSGKQVSIVSKSANNEIFVIKVGSGKFYIYSKLSNKLSALN